MVTLIKYGDLFPDVILICYYQKLLKMPDSDSPDDVVHELLHKLAGLFHWSSLFTIVATQPGMDLSNYTRGKEQLKYLGVFGASIPKQYGGLGLSSAQFAYLIQNRKLIDWALMLIAHQNLCAQVDELLPFS